jgi:hypothetical protein
VFAAGSRPFTRRDLPVVRAPRLVSECVIHVSRASVRSRDLLVKARVELVYDVAGP